MCFVGLPNFKCYNLPVQTIYLAPNLFFKIPLIKSNGVSQFYENIPRVLYLCVFRSPHSCDEAMNHRFCFPSKKSSCFCRILAVYNFIYMFKYFKTMQVTHLTAKIKSSSTHKSTSRNWSTWNLKIFVQYFRIHSFQNYAWYIYWTIFINVFTSTMKIHVKNKNKVKVLMQLYDLRRRWQWWQVKKTTI